MPTPMRGAALRGRRHTPTLTLAVALVAGLLAGPAAAGGVAVAQAAPSPCPAPVPVRDLRAGQLGTGLTVSRGTQPESFSVEILGVLAGGIAPGIDMILVEADSPAIQAAGGIWAGMSGSPVYAADGRLIGAVAYGLAGASPIAGLTPAEEMLKLLTIPAGAATKPAATVKLPGALARRIVSRGAASAPQAAAGMRQLRLPLGISGLSGAHFDKVAEAVGKSKLSVIPFQAAALAPGAPADPAEIQPGGNFAAAVSYGDVTAAGVGTTTAVCDGQALAFGHPFTFAGTTTLSAHAADAVVIQPDQLFGPFKVANLGGVAGLLDQDRLVGIRAGLGAGPTPIPITSRVSATPIGDSRDGTTLVNRSQFVPGIATSHLLSNLDRVTQRIGEGTALVSWTASGRTAGGTPFVLRRTNRFASQFDVSFEAIFELLDYLAIIEANPFTDVRFSTVGAVASADGETFQRYDLKKVQQKVGPNRWADVGAGRPIRTRANGVLQVRIVIGSYRDRLPVLNLDLAYKIPRDKGGARGVLDVTGGLTDFNDDIFFCLFDPAACATSGGAATLGTLMEKLKARPRNDQLSATLVINPAPGRPNRGVSTKAVRFLSQVVTGHKVVPVVIAR
ncbi:MAG TPA: SpoIVB peptidase S55 domain-containing protein [Actinomycetota bacterium]|nr:SpoIVB peptidase S55 domain-containing protein [Actinomycetota bacterium]